MQPFLTETKLPREPKLSCELKFEPFYVMRCEFLFVSLLACAEDNTVESDGAIVRDLFLIGSVLVNRA